MTETGGEDLQRWKRIIRITLIVATLLFLFLWITGYRFTAFSAAKSNSFVTRKDHLIGHYQFGNAQIFLFKNDNKKIYQTVLSKRSGVLYRSNSSTHISYRTGSVVTVGGTSVTFQNGGLTFISIQSNDPTVAYIEAGNDPNRKKKKIDSGERIAFMFPYGVQIDHLNAAAYNAQGKKLYYYGYPKDMTMINPDKDLKWYKVK